jgi:L-arabonate dehydrase
MPEVGNMATPKKLLAKGVTDMVRISDGRMNGTGFGTVVLHASPEAALDGNFALVRDGDVIQLDVPGRSLVIDVSPEEFEKRKRTWKPRHKEYSRGHLHLPKACGAGSPRSRHGFSERRIGQRGDAGFTLMGTYVLQSRFNE